MKFARVFPVASFLYLNQTKIKYDKSSNCSSYVIKRNRKGMKKRRILLTSQIMNPSEDAVKTTGAKIAITTITFTKNHAVINRTKCAQKK